MNCSQVHQFKVLRGYICLHAGCCSGENLNERFQLMRLEAKIDKQQHFSKSLARRRKLISKASPICSALMSLSLLVFVYIHTIGMFCGVRWGQYVEQRARRAPSLMSVPLLLSAVCLSGPHSFCGPYAQPSIHPQPRHPACQGRPTGGPTDLPEMQTSGALQNVARSMLSEA